MISALRLTMRMMAVPAAGALALQAKPKVAPAKPNRPMEAPRPEKLRTDGWRDFDLKTRDFRYEMPDMRFEMPNMDGLSLTARIRADDAYRELPIILVTSLASDEDRSRGAEAGASAYIPKSMFDQTLLLDTLRRLA